MVSTGKHRPYAIATALIVALFASSAARLEALEEGRDRDRHNPEAPRPLGVEPKLRPPQGPEFDRWYLGITSVDVAIGVAIRSVAAHSPAARAGLEPSDVVVTVNGYQVGRVGGTTYPLNEELQRRADAAGRVTLLVQDHRTNRLVNVPITMARGETSSQSIRGVVEYRERMALPPNAVLRMTVQRRTFRGMETVAEQTFTALGQPPIPFELRLPHEGVFLQEEYYVTAEIRGGGRRLLVSEQPYVFRLAQSPQDIRIMLRRP